MPPANEHREDLDLTQGVEHSVRERGFGAAVDADGEHLILPRDLFDFLRSQYVTTAAGFVAYVRAFPEEVADSLHMKPNEVSEALPDLIREVAKVIPAEALSVVSPEPFGYGTMD